LETNQNRNSTDNFLLMGNLSLFLRNDKIKSRDTRLIFKKRFTQGKVGYSQRFFAFSATATLIQVQTSSKFVSQ